MNENKYIVVIWEYGDFNGEINFIEAKGPFSFKEAHKIETEYIHKYSYADKVKMKGE